MERKVPYIEITPYQDEDKNATNEAVSKGNDYIQFMSTSKRNHNFKEIITSKKSQLQRNHNFKEIKTSKKSYELVNKICIFE